MPYLIQITDSNYERFAVVLVMQAAGQISGSLLGGILATKFYEHFQMSMVIGLILLSVLSILVPWCSQVELLGLVLFLQSFGGGHISPGKLIFILSAAHGVILL